MLPSGLTLLGYTATIFCFMYGVYLLRSPATALRGNRLAAVGMLLVLGITFGLISSSHHWALIALPIAGGAAAGVYAARMVRMTAMPQMVALFNGMGGGAAALVATQDFRNAIAANAATADLTWSIMAGVVIGSLSFAGSLVAFAKLQGILPGRPIIYQYQRELNGVLAVFVLALAFLGIFAPSGPQFDALLVVALVLGVLFVVPIGGADMPVIISLLNSFTGLAAAITGFVLSNDVLIVSGALVGASGTILTLAMGKAMNRSLVNVLFSGFGATVETPGGGGESGGTIHPTSVEDVAPLLAFANLVIFVPGYGLAVSRAQHDLKELAAELEKRGVSVEYAIHPVAGRMPGHMNVLLAEADVPYPQLKEMEQVNPDFPRADVAIVVGANDVVNPAARNQQNSPIYGMPILNADQAKTVVVLKRSMAPGFAGVDNPLFYKPNTLMLFGDARKSIDELLAEVKRQ